MKCAVVWSTAELSEEQAQAVFRRFDLRTGSEREGIHRPSAVNVKFALRHLRSDGDRFARLRKTARELIAAAKKNPKDWTQEVCRKSSEVHFGIKPNGPRVALVDFGTKENILRELLKRTKEVKIFPSWAKANEVLDWRPDGILLSNGPGNPEDVKDGIELVRQLIGHKYIFGICMGHQVLALALGGRTYKLKFGHRGSNHPIRDHLLGKVYVTSQNHGYNVDQQSLPVGAVVSHINLNDGTVAGMHFADKKCMSVQFHPESHPGPHDSVELFDYFVNQMR